MRLSTLVITMVVIVLVAGCSTTGFNGANSDTTVSERATTTTDTTTTDQTSTDSDTESSVPTTSFGSSEGGLISVYPAEQLPSNATVINGTDTQIQNITLVQNLLRKTAENGDASRDVNKTQLERLQKELKNIPDSHGTNSEYYIRYQGTVYRLLIIVDD